jgi:hypothetical protein
VYSVAPGDIFIHTWDRVNSKYGSFWNGNVNSMDGHHENISSQTVDLDGLKQIYKPKSILIESDPGVDLAFSKYPQMESMNIAPAHVGVYNMFKSQNDVYQLTIPYGSYDRYFSCRLDLMFHNKLDYAELENSSHLMISPNIGPAGFLMDFFAFGTTDTMRIRSNFYSHIWDYWYSKSISDHIENVVAKYYSDNDINVRESGLRFEVKRLF